MILIESSLSLTDESDSWTEAEGPCLSPLRFAKQIEVVKFLDHPSFGFLVPATKTHYHDSDSLLCNTYNTHVS